MTRQKALENTNEAFEKKSLQGYDKLCAKVNKPWIVTSLAFKDFEVQCLDDTIQICLQKDKNTFTHWVETHFLSYLKIGTRLSDGKRVKIKSGHDVSKSSFIKSFMM